MPPILTFFAGRGIVYVWIGNQVGWKTTVDYVFDPVDPKEEALDKIALSLSCLNVTGFPFS